MDWPTRSEMACRWFVDSHLEGTGFEPSVPLLRKALLGVVNRRRRHERRSHLQVQVRNGNAPPQPSRVGVTDPEGAGEPRQHRRAELAAERRTAGLCLTQQIRFIARRRSGFSHERSLRINPNGRPFVRTVLFPKSSTEIIDNWQVIGLRGTGSDSYRATTSSSRRNTPRRATTRPSGARGSPPSLYERHDLRRELLEHVARHSPPARSTPSSCVIQHAATD
jgi:hypothetical protein